PKKEIGTVTLLPLPAKQWASYRERKLNRVRSRLRWTPMARNPVNETSRRRRPAAPKHRNQRIKVRLRNPNAVIRLKFTLPPGSETPRTFSDSRRRNRRPSRRETVKRTAIPYNRTSDIELRSTHRVTALTWGSTAPEIQPNRNERERYNLDDDGRLLLRLDDQVPGGRDETSSDEAARRRSASTHGEHEA
ncbi:hypothetical protein HID58_045266, partial [Brassica napus]